MRRLFSGFVIAITLATFIACLPISPSAVNAKKCPNALFCLSVKVPQTVSGGTCCVGYWDVNASVGYLCAYGSNHQPAGCYRSTSEASKACPGASIVRCEAQ